MKYIPFIVFLASLIALSWGTKAIFDRGPRRPESPKPYVLEYDGREFLVNPAGGLIEITKPIWTAPMTLEDGQKKP